MRAGVAYDATLVRVFYATDRLRVPGTVDNAKYDWHRSPEGRLEYGECHVSIPDIHITGQLESPSLLKFEFRPDPNKHIVLAKTTTLEEDQFFEKVRLSVLRSEKKDAFVFIHGYNVTFEDAARRAGQFAYDLKFVGAPVFYSWPSNGNVADYLKDETNVAWSIPHLQTFLSLLAQRSGAERVHVVAHSMGNRAVCEALRLLSYDPGYHLQLNHLVLAAPDIDAETFAELSRLLRRLSTNITLYESRNDKALLASKKIHGYVRAGEPLLVLEGLDTVDASAIDTDFLGHSYFSSDYALLSDIHSMLASDEPAAGRIGLSLRESASGSYYEFRPH
jgi:esterase/lipase superfamily enzyme